MSARHSVSATRALLLEKAGYSVTRVETLDEGIECLRNRDFNLVLAGYLLATRERAELATATKSLKPNLPFVAFHAGPPLVNEEASLAPLDGPESLLRKVGELIMREHRHSDLKGKYYAYVDRLRLYVHVSDGVCDLLGYERDELIGKRIDEVTFPESADVDGLFRRYLKDGSQEGRYRLLHKNGKPVAIDYKARVLEDGCLVSEWEPCSGSSRRSAKATARQPARKTVRQKNSR